MGLAGNRAQLAFCSSIQNTRTRQLGLLGSARFKVKERYILEYLQFYTNIVLGTSRLGLPWLEFG